MATSANEYRLSVFFRLISDAVVVHVLLLKVPMALAWVKEHADEIAQMQFANSAVKNYCALNVEEVRSSEA